MQIDSLQFFLFSWRLHPSGIVGKISCWWEYTLLLQIQEWCSLSFLFDQRPPVQLPSVGKEKNFNSHDDNVLCMRGSRFFFGGVVRDNLVFWGGGVQSLFSGIYYVNLLCEFIKFEFSTEEVVWTPDPTPLRLDPCMLCIVRIIFNRSLMGSF